MKQVTDSPNVTSTSVSEESIGRSGRLRQKLMQLSMTLTGIGVGLLVISLFAVVWLRSHSDHLAQERTPAVVSAQQAQIGLQRSLAALRGWVTLGDDRFRAGRAAAWAEEIEPAIAAIDDLARAYPESSDISHLRALAPLLVELKESQWWIEDVAQTEGNQPALYTLHRRVGPVVRSIDRLIDRMFLDSREYSRARNEDPRVAALVNFERAFSDANNAVTQFVGDGEANSLHVFLTEEKRAERVLRKLARSPAWPSTVVTYLAQEFAAYQRFAWEAVAARQSKSWNVALYRMQTETVPLNQRISARLDQLTASQLDLMEGDTRAITFTGTASIILSSALILFMAAIAYALANYRSAQITLPVTRLSEATEDLAQGTLNEDLPITTDDELATLTDSFNRMRAKLQQAERALRQSNLQLHEANEDLEQYNQFIRATFGRYMSDDIVSSLLDTPAGLDLGGERRQVTILMSDLRGFTSMVARLTPEQVVDILNRFLGAMVEVITLYQGTVDEFIGDAILVIFGAPIETDDHATRAVACAIAMQREMEAVNLANVRDGLPEIEMGIGVNTGDVVVGNIGSESRAKYGVVGSTVNLTSRIESYTVGGQVLISDATRREVAESLLIDAELEIEAKGLDETTIVHDVRGIEGDFALHLPDIDDELVTLTHSIPLRATIIEGKHIGGQWLRGRLVRLSAHAATVMCDETVAPFSNLKIVIDADVGEISCELYAKVTGILESDQPGFDIHLTSVPPELAAWLESLR